MFLLKIVIKSVLRKHLTKKQKKKFLLYATQYEIEKKKRNK